MAQEALEYCAHCGAEIKEPDKAVHRDGRVYCSEACAEAEVVAELTK